MRGLLDDLLRRVGGPGDLAAVLRGAGVILAIRVAAAGLAYVVIVVLARWMGAQQYGVYAYALAWCVLLGMPAGMGLHAACVRFLPEYAAAGAWGKARGILARSTVLTLASGAAIALVALAIAYALRERIADEYRAALAMALLGVPVIAMATLAAQVGRAFGWVGTGYGPPQLAQPLLLLAALAALRAAGVALAATVVVPLALGLFAALTLVQAAVYVMRLAPRVRGVAPEYAQRRWLRVAVPLLLIDGFAAIIAQADLIMVGSLRGATEAAHYAAATRTAALVTFALASITGLAGPKIAQLHAQGRRGDLQALLTGLVPWILIPTVLTTVGLATLGPWLLRLFGHGFEAGYPAMLVLAVGALGASLAGPASVVLTMTGHQDASARTFGAVALANVLLNVVLIPRWGMVGASLATAVTAVVGSARLRRLARRDVGVDPALRPWRAAG